MSSGESDSEVTPLDSNPKSSSSETVETLFKLPGSGNKGVTGKRPRKKQFRWNYNKDLALVTEVERCQPFHQVGSDVNEKWQEVASAVASIFNDSVSMVGAKERLNRILAAHKKEDFKNRYKSGTEEQVTTLTDQLAKLASIIEDKKLEEQEANVGKTKKLDQERAAGEEIRKAATTATLKRKGETLDESPKCKRTSERSLIDLWKDKQEQDRITENQRIERELEQRTKDRELRREELLIAREKLEQENLRIELDRQRLQLEKEKMKAETRLAHDRFELDKIERMNQMKTQEALIQLLSKK